MESSRMNKFLITLALLTSIAVPVNAATPQYYYGDSIAVGFGGSNPGSRRVGASPAEILRFLQSAVKSNPNIFKDKIVNISTGVSNNPSDFADIEKQFILLQNSGAKVIVIGAAMGRFDHENIKLATLCKKYAFTFKGGFIPGSDGVHPYTYLRYVTND